MSAYHEYIEPNKGPIAAAVFAVSLFYFVIYPLYLSPLARFPGPFWAKLTRFYLASIVRKGHRSEVIDSLHRKYGKFVRIGPNEVSVADPDALTTIYAHGNGALKTDFYDAFVSIHRGLFNTRDRADHTRKRKMVSHTFSPQSVREFEPYIEERVRSLLKKWDGIIDNKDVPHTKGYAFIDSLHWFNALAFDIIGDLAFGTPFGMIDRDGADVVALTNENGETIHANAVKILNERGEYSATLGSMPPFIRPYMKYIDPWYNRGAKSVANLAGIARFRVNERLKNGAGDRKDILAHLQSAKDANGNPIGKAELTAEALTQLIAGSDTTSNSSCAIIYYLAKNHDKLENLQKALDAAFDGHDINGVVDYDAAKSIDYLNACISEALRRHSTSGMGLPRTVVKDIVVAGEQFPPGTVLSVPSYSLHHLDSIWGDPFVYRPERWLGPDAKELEKHLNVFSYGPRSCVGRNLAMMELTVFIATLCYRYDFVLQDPNFELPVVEGFLRKPEYCMVGIKKREHV